MRSMRAHADRQTKAAVLREFGAPFVVEQLQLDPPQIGEVGVRLAASGVCRSDLATVDGVDPSPSPLPVILGHEGAGVVDCVGDGVVGLEVGDHVVLSWLPYCGRCRSCSSGRPNLCENLDWFDAGTMRDGTTRFHRDGAPVYHHVPASFADRSVVPAETALLLDHSVPLEEAALMGCAVMTGVGAVLNTARVRPGESVIVIGCGGVGLNVVQGASIAGASPIVAVDVVREKLDLARALGATDAVDASEAGHEDVVRQIVNGGADHAFEVLGNPRTTELAIRLIRDGGTAVLVGLAQPGAQVSIDPAAITLGARRIIGSWYGSCVPPRDFPVLLDLYRSGRLNLERLIGAKYRLEDINEAFGRLRRSDVGRAVITYDIGNV
jgi:S-(hydroxymethyl)glutathione dehydrogenase/alcohol dehydrogenase